RSAVKSPDLFESYWNNPDATRAVRSEDGWLRTGEWNAGALRLVDRARDFIVTSGGKTISPSFVENILRASPYIAGHGRKYLAGRARGSAPPRGGRAHHRFVELERYRHAPVDGLPFGIQKLVGFARALAFEPAILMLDEPSAGLNRDEREDLARFIL